MGTKWDADEGDDYMPNPRRTREPDPQNIILASGQAVYQAAAAQQPLGLIQYIGEAEGPLCLQLGSPGLPNVISEAGVEGNGFFPANVFAEGVCFTRSDLAQQYPPRIQCILEYGLGASTREVRFDWRPGAYQLPPCSSLKVSVLANPAVSPGQYTASLARGSLGQQFDVPTFTFMGDGFASIAPGGPEYSLPVGAHAVELLGGPGTFLTNSFQRYELTVGGAYVPPVAPMRLNLGRPASTPFWRFEQVDTSDTSIIRFLIGL